MRARAALLLPAASLLLILFGCGPRAGDFGAGGVDRGAKPAIITRFSTIPNPDWSIEGDEVTFPIPFKVRAQDQDANMRWVEITVLYVDSCAEDDQVVELTEDLPPADWAKFEIDVTESTTEAVRVPRACYPAGDQFDVRLRVRDSRGNLSNLLKETVTVGAGQGPGAP